ncbi:TPA: fimbrial protein [Serratia marcescens]|nr:fimbrial protein [Serratia marcescens]
MRVLGVFNQRGEILITQLNKAALQLWSFLFLLLISGSTYAVSCVSGCGNVVRTTISQQLSSGENAVGKTKSSNSIITPGVTVRYSAGQANGWGVYAGEEIREPGFYGTDWNYKKIDDYISVALRDTDECTTRYLPFNMRVRDGDTCNVNTYSDGQIVVGSPHTYQSQIRIDKKIVSGTYSKHIKLAEVGLCQPGGACAKKDVVMATVYLDLDITVPQSCELNAGQVISIDFGNISSGAFKTAGEIAQGVQPKSKTVSVKCDNIAGNSQLTLRLQADKTNGNIVVSDENNDVGFRVTNNSGTPLIPNNLSSVIPFTLDSNARQNVTIQAYPVSVTGNKPTEGPVTSRGYLRVDFP